MIEQQPPLPPSLPTVSTVLFNQFKTISGGDVRLFKQVYLALWRWLWPISRFDTIALAYLLPGVLGQITPRVTTHQWFTLCKLYFLTSGGGAAVNTRNYQFTPMEGQHITYLMKQNIVVRTTFDPAAPHAVKPSHINKTYISFTAYGISFYKVVVKNVHKASYIDTYRLTVDHKTNSPDS